MRLVKPSIEFLWMTDNPLQAIERACRTCYKSENKITLDSAGQFVKKLLDRGHEAMIEHASASYRVVCDRGVSHEIVRHRLFSYAQESTRYCNYENGVSFIIPCWTSFSEGVVEAIKDIAYYHSVFDDKNEDELLWLKHMACCEINYQVLIDNYLYAPQQARSILPNSLKTEIVITGNLREWRHFFKLRCAKSAHPQMQEIANMLLKDIQEKIPLIFEKLSNI